MMRWLDSEPLATDFHLFLVERRRAAESLMPVYNNVEIDYFGCRVLHGS